jgi:hypothetical protein
MLYQTSLCLTFKSQLKYYHFQEAFPDQTQAVLGIFSHTFEKNILAI